MWSVLALTSFLLSYWGWYDQSATFHAYGLRAHENAIFMALRVFGFSSAYVDPKLMGNDWRLLVSRWTGLVVVTATVVAAGLELFRAEIAEVKSSWLRRHILIIGDHDMAIALVTEAVRRRLSAIHISAAVAKPQQTGALITLPRLVGEDPLTVGRAAYARRVVVAETELGASMELALRALEQTPAVETATPKVAVHLDDPVTAERIHHVPGGLNLFSFSEAQVTARTVLFRHPPFLLARRIGAPAVHVVIVGFGRLGQAIARDVVLNCAVSDLGEPHITVIEPLGEAAQREFLYKHPSFNKACEFKVFVDLEGAMSSTGPDSAAPAPPVCATFVCIRDTADGLAEAAALCERIGQYDQIQGPVFVRIRSGGPQPPRGGLGDLVAGKMYTFGAVTDLGAQSRALDDDPDAEARMVHQVYAEIGGYEARPWETLTEDLRVSSRRVVTHVPAKLASLGLDLEPWLRTPDDERPWPPVLARDETLYREGARDRRAAAALEHARWTADRHVNGWRHGLEQDNSRKIHVALTPFEDLSDEFKAFNFAVADWLETLVKVRTEGAAPADLRRPKD